MRLAFVILMGTTATAIAAGCEVRDVQSFGEKKVSLLGADGVEDWSAIGFRSGLRVNTDGAPNSYSPTDLTGSVNAINSICNAFSVRNAAGEKQKCPKVREVFAQYRDANWQPPTGYSLTWQNVLAARKVGGVNVPCVFSSGDFKGHLGSLTTLKNGLSGDKAGECEVNDQVDQTKVPTMVLPGGTNAVRAFGAKIGDLAVVYNPKNGVRAAAVIADSGPPDNLGEGSVALNMSLLKVSTQPKTYAEAKKLDTGGNEMLVMIFPKSIAFERERPYSAANLERRVNSLAVKFGYAGTAELIDGLAGCVR